MTAEDVCHDVAGYHGRADGEASSVYANVATTGPWSLDPNSRCTTQVWAAPASACDATT